MQLLGFDLAGTRVWETPELVAINRLPMRPSVWPCPSREIAVASTSDGNPWLRSLDGQWRFALAERPEAAPADFMTRDFDDTDWSSVAVPGLFTMQGYGKPIYTNVQMPFRPQPPFVPVANPTGLYRTEFSVPRDWRGRRTVLHFGGAESVLLVWLNGVAVGLSKDSRLAAEFDVTDQLKIGRRNTLAVMVIRWSDASYVEDQDQWWQAGIHRSVAIHSTESTFIADIHTNATLSDDLSTGEFHATIALGYQGRTRPEEGWSVEVVLETLGGSRVGAPTRENIPHLQVPYDFVGHQATAQCTVRNVKAWSNETPNLYRVVVSLLAPDGSVREVSALRVGFRRVEIRGKELLVNNQPVQVYGVNRHDFDPDTGRVLSATQIRADLVLMKQFGFNAVRTSHSPNDPILLDLCDELGMLVVDEANVESHALNTSLCHDGRYLEAIMQRGRRMVQRDVNHPCIIMWSLGNESGHGASHDALAGWIRNYDPTRPLHYEGAIMMDWQAGHAATDVLCPMYPEIWAIEHAARTADRPVILCEYSHAMGNSNGCLGEYFDAFQNHYGLQGGFIWEFWDHGLRQYLDDSGAPVESTGVVTDRWRYAYGGDFGERRHDANFVCDGMVWPDRTPKPAMWEHKYLARPLASTVGGSRRGTIEIENRLFFRDSSWLRVKYAVEVDGVVSTRGRVAMDTIAPRSRAKVSLPIDWNALPKGETIVTLTYHVARATDWCEAGFEIGHDQIAIDRGAPNSPKPAAPPGAMTVWTRNNHGSLTTVHGAGVSAHFDHTAGTLTRVEHNGRPILVEAPRLTLWRAPIDNDGLKLALGSLTPFGRWRNWGLDALQSSCTKVAFSRSGTAIIFTAHHDLVGTDPTAIIQHRQRITFGATGALRFDEEVRVPQRFADLPRVGIRFDLAPGYESLRYFGDGPHDCYPDRQRGARLALHAGAVADEYVPYIMPQEHGLHTNTRWIELQSPHAPKLRIDAPKPFMFSALHHTPEQLTHALHDVDLTPRTETTIHIDHAHRGLGTASCGPDTLAEYKVKPARFRWVWNLTVS